MANEELHVETNEVDTLKDSKGCIGVLLSIGTYFSALICCVIFVVVLKKADINTSILFKVKYGLFFTGLFCSLLYFVSNILHSKNNQYISKHFGLITNICKNMLFYTGCGLLSIIYNVHYLSYINLIAGLAFIKFSANAAVQNYYIKNSNK